MRPSTSQPGIITLTTDFGLRDHYVGVMKGVIVGIDSAARVIDISHGIPAHDVLEGAFAIAQAWRYFPAGSIHVVVVDPGVGSTRRAIAAACGDHLFVAPDNGVLSQVFEAAASYEVRTLDRRHGLESISRTFHGRDLFAPLAARLSAGLEFDELGDPLENPILLPATSPVDGIGRVLHVDSFGNIVTSFREEHVKGERTIQIGDLKVGGLRESYAAGPEGEPFLIVGSSGYVEVSINRASAAKRAGVNAGDLASIS